MTISDIISEATRLVVATFDVEPISGEGGGGVRNMQKPSSLHDQYGHRANIWLNP